MIREGNYTNFPGFYGMLMRNCYTFPLSSNRDTMKKFLSSMDTVLQHGDFMLVYPEQSMWWNYRKPKPLKKGAYTFAAKTMCRCFLALSPWKTATSSGMMAFMCRNTRYTLQSRFIRTHRKHRQKMWMRCAEKCCCMETDLRRVLRNSFSIRYCGSSAVCGKTDQYRIRTDTRPPEDASGGFS